MKHFRVSFTFHGDRFRHRVSALNASEALTEAVKEAAIGPPHWMALMCGNMMHDPETYHLVIFNEDDQTMDREFFTKH